MQSLTITFTPKTEGFSNTQSKAMLRHALVSKGTAEKPPKFGFDSGDYFNSDETESEYFVAPVFERDCDGDWCFKGFRVNVSPPQYTMGHSILSGNDMHTSVRVAFHALKKTWRKIHENDPFIDLFSPDQVELEDVTLSFYSEFPNHEAARSALTRVVESLHTRANSDYSEKSNYSEPQCSGTFSDTIWSVHGVFCGMIVKLFVADDPNVFEYAGDMSVLMEDFDDELGAYARTVLVARVLCYDTCLNKMNLNNPLVWDLPRSDTCKSLCKKMMNELGLNRGNILRLRSQPTLPHSLTGHTFNRETGTALLRSFG